MQQIIFNPFVSETPHLNPSWSPQTFVLPQSPWIFTDYFGHCLFFISVFVIFYLCGFLFYFVILTLYLSYFDIQYRYVPVHTVSLSRWCMEHWIWPGLEHSSSVDCLVFPHIYAACPDSVPFVATIASGLTPLLGVNLGHWPTCLLTPWESHQTQKWTPSQQPPQRPHKTS